MNEITHIHLGRQPFTISVEAHKALRKYLADIHHHVADAEVAEEVELRMSELLTERGITGEKVILPADVDYLKQQLGDPADFSDETADPASATTTSANPDAKTSKRLFRDTDTALVAGVAAGLAHYTGLDVVIVRLLFILLTIFAGGIGAVAYILFWLVVPRATTASEKLQMRGEPVTLEALKNSVNGEEVRSAARRINKAVLPVINGILQIGVRIVGAGFILGGVAVLAFAALVKMYMTLHGGRLFQENIFPVGAREDWLLIVGLGVAAIGAIFLILVGIATFIRKWPIRGWITATLAGLFLVGIITSGALAADIAPRVQERYETMTHTTAVRDIEPFSKVVTKGNIDIEYDSSPDYSVDIHYVDNPDLSKLHIYVAGGTLYIDSQALDNSKHCTMLCLFPEYDMYVIVSAPNVEDFTTPPRTDMFYERRLPPNMHMQTN